MNNIEKNLKDIKNYIDNIEIPSELEGRLRKAIDNKTIKRRKNLVGKVVAACLTLLLIGYNFDTLAFYSKEIIGYNNVMNKDLKELNDLGKGQIINKSHTFKNGVSITLDGIMVDESQLLAFYTIKAPDGNVDEVTPRITLNGLFGEHMLSSGYGDMNDEGTIMKNMYSFEPPYFFEKTLHLSFGFYEDGRSEEGEITFKLDRQKAMGNKLKKNINKSIELDETKIHFDSILASPTRTVINGSIQNILQLAIDKINDERLIPNDLEIRLIANNKEVKAQSSGMRTNIKGITFHREYDALPQNLKSLELELVSFSADHVIDKVIDLKKDLLNQKFNVNNQDIIINKIYESNGNTFVDITTEENTFLTKICLLVDDKSIELNNTTKDEYEKLENGKILHRRTLEFNVVGKNHKLDIKRMKYSKSYNKTITIPID
jgi:hypothetical protein